MSTHFKAFNDRYGHPAGDACLASVAEAIANTAQRPTDVTARYGGEEFAVVLPSTELEGATNIAEQVRGSVAALDIRHPDNPRGTITVSIGASVIVPRLTDSPEAFLSATDSALYAAKRAGRNQVVSVPAGDHAPRVDGVAVFAIGHGV